MKMYNDFEFMLANFGILDYISPIGEGHFSKVYATNRMTVLKFTVDDMYDSFVQLCKKVDNPMFPKILNDFGVVADCNGTKLYAYELPMYTSWSDALPFQSDEFSDIFEDFKSNLNRLLSIDAKFNTEAVYDRNWSVVCHVFTHRDRKGILDICETCLKFGLDFNDFMDTINLLRNVFGEDEGAFFDLHGGNWMCDPKTGQLIISDPVGSHTTAGYGFWAIDGIGNMKVSELENSYNVEKAEEISKLFTSGDAASMKLFKFKKSLHSEDTVSEFTEKSLSGWKVDDKETIKSIVVKSKSTHKILRKPRRDVHKADFSFRLYLD